MIGLILLIELLLTQNISLFDLFNYSFGYCPSGYSLQDCNALIQSSRWILFIFITTTIMPFIEFFTYLTILNKLYTPFLTKRPSQFVAIIKHGEVKIKEMKRYRPIVLIDKKLYWLKHGILDNFGNKWFIFRENVNQELMYENEDLDKILEIYTLSTQRNKDLEIKERSIKYIPRKIKEQMITHWDMVIRPTEQDYEIVLIPAKKETIKQGLWHKMAVKKYVRISIVKNDNENYSSSNGLVLSYNEMLKSAVITRNNLYADKAYQLYKAFREAHENFVSDLMGEFRLNWKILLIVGVVGLIIMLMIMMQNH